MLRRRRVGGRRLNSYYYSVALHFLNWPGNKSCSIVFLFFNKMANYSPNSKQTNKKETPSSHSKTLKPGIKIIQI